MLVSELSYQAQILHERKQQEADLRTSELGWLTLAGLHPLREGQNRFGCDVLSEIILPEGQSPHFAGILHFHAGKIRLEAAPGAKITHNGGSVTTLVMEPDKTGNPTYAKMGSLTMLVIQRGNSFYLRVYDSRAKGKKQFGGLKHYPVDERFRVMADFTAYEPPKPVTALDVVGNSYETICPGYVSFQLDGHELHLDADSLDNVELFFNFLDATNADETYPGGRFLLTGPLENGKVELDFNRAYNPPCAYTDFATCPVPPPKNWLNLRIEAGEKRMR